MEITKLSQIQSIEDFGDRGIHEVETLLRKLRQDEYDQIGNPNYPSKPHLKSNTPSQDDIQKYQVELAEYERLKEEYDSISEKKRGIGNEQYQLLEEYVKYKAGFFTDVPAQYKDKVWRMAWELGHSAGYGEVFIYLCDLVDIFR